MACLFPVALCSAGDLPMEAFVQIIDDGEHIRNRTTRRYGEAIIQSDYGAPGATIDVHAAAFRHVLDKAHSLGPRSELIELIAGLLDEAKVQSHGRQQLPAMFEVIVGMHQAIVY
ncbi:imine reductase family protein [Brucella cytisi]|uniref:imine reductase family protein n=1 Tax=Brucella cytisi TaxID=407152 RepID=UPI0035E27578